MVYDPEVGESREILARRYGLTVPRFSPDGESVAFFGEVAGGAEVSVVRADGQGIRQVTRGDGQFNIHPRWGADGETVYFYRDTPARAGSPGDFLKVAVDGGVGEVVLPGFSWDRFMFGEVHPSEPWILFTRIEGPYPRAGPLVVRDLESGEDRVFPTPAEWDSDPPLRLFLPRWSHDGRHIVAMDLGFAFRDGGRNRVWVCTVEGDCRSVLDGTWPVWSGDDAHIYFAKLISGYDEVEIWIADRDGQSAQLVTDIGPLNSPWYDVAPDGRIVWVLDRPGRPEIWVAEIAQ